MAAHPREVVDKIVAKGSFTPPPASCGGESCRYEGFDLVHDDDCKEKD